MHHEASVPRPQLPPLLFHSAQRSESLQPPSHRQGCISNLHPLFIHSPQETQSLQPHSHRLGNLSPLPQLLVQSPQKLSLLADKVGNISQRFFNSS